MNRIASWIKSHQIIAFFIIAFAITWGLGFSYGAVMNKGIFLLAPVVVIATCGPALAGVIISAVINTQPRKGTKRAYWIAFIVGWGVSSLVFLSNNTFLNHAPFSPIMVGFTLVSVVPVAFVISMAYSRIPSVRSYLSSLIRLSGVWGWAFLALVLMPALILLSIFINSFRGGQPITALSFPASGLALIGLVAVKFFYQLFFFNGTGEETGWRGFALPRLQAGTSPFIASLVLAFFWAPWHFFLWQAEGKPVFSMQYWVEQYVGLIPATFLLVWLYNRSKGSILVAGIAHAAANTAFAFVPGVDWLLVAVVNSVVVFVLVLVDRMWKRLPCDHPAVYSRKYEIKGDLVDETG
jgi:membrane protease YdiL (CAAX protease family)